MATRLKPTRINVDNTPRVGDGAAYQNDNDFHWSMGGGDMAYRDFEWHTLTGTSLVIEDISNNITPSSDFTVSAGTVKPGIEYVLRVNTGNTAYTMTLGTGVTNPNGYSTELTPNKVNQFKFIATSNSQLELEGVDTSEYLTGLTILSYGNSTWNDFITAYNKNSIVYCRASSNSNPASGSQTRLAFMAYVNNATSPTEVEFQYYRSRSSHSTAQNQQDEVYVYKLTSTSGGTWTVEVRDTAAKAIAGTGIGLTFNSSGMTISADTTVLATKTDLNSKQDTISDLATIRTGAGLGATALQPGDNVSELTNDSGYITSSYHDSSKQDVLTAGTGIDITGTTISATNNTKTFYLTIGSSTTAIQKGQECYDWYKAGNNPIVSYNGVNYHLSKVDSTGMLFKSENDSMSSTSASVSTLQKTGMTIQLNGDTVTGVFNTVLSVGKVLATDVDYSTVYTPQYDGSPATKKYVDDAIAGVGGGIEVDENSPIQLTKIRAGTQAQYDALSSYDSTCVYLTI